MGNSNSHLAPSRFTPSLFHGHLRKDGRVSHSNNVVQTTKNKVLPAVAVDQQRLRTTDNGSILQNGGTISGRKSTSSNQVGDGEFLRLLQNKCKVVHPGPQSESFHTLYGHRKSHSDPDIVRKMMMYDDDTDGDDDDSDGRFQVEVNGNTKSIIAVSPSKAKIKSRKKNRAPEPPQSNTLPKSSDRLAALYSSHNDVIHKKNEMGKTVRRPLPPIPVEEIPPPPPPPDYNGDQEERSIFKMPSKNYEKNKRVVDKWKLTKMPTDEKMRQRSKSLERSEDQRSKEDESHQGFSRFVRNASVKDGAKPGGQESGVMRKQISESALNEAIARMEKRKYDKSHKTDDLARHPTENCGGQRLPKRNGQSNVENRRQYYFADMNSSREITSPPKPKESQMDRKEACTLKPREDRVQPEGSTFHSPHRQHGLNHAIDRSRRKTSHNAVPGRRMQRISRKTELDKNDTKLSKWHLITNDSMLQFLTDGDTQLNSTSSEEEIEIDLQLRPTLPKRPLKVPHFSPSDAWKSINFDFFKDFNRRSDVSSDDGEEILEEKIHRVNRPVAPRRISHHRSVDSGISPDAGSPMFLNDSFEALLNPTPTPTMPQTQEIAPLKTAWIPQHDLADDNDSGSENSSPEQFDKSVKQDLQAKFSLPNLMFPSKSLPRTDYINTGTEEKLNTYEKGRSKHKRSRKHSQKNGDVQHFNSLRNLKKALGLRGKTPTADESKELDSNWSLSQSLPNSVNNLATNHTDVGCTERTGSPFDTKRKNSDSRVINQPSKISRNDSNFSLGQQAPPQRNGRWRNTTFVNHPSEGHVIYLPQYSCQEVGEDATRLGEEPQAITDSELVVKKKVGRKKFSYQSTVKQMEKKKLEKQASKEVEESEKKRQQEIEWMNKVEEEFRKQRDKEKVNIRHQLRIFHLQNKATSHPAHKDRSNHSSPGTEGVGNSAKPQMEENHFQERPSAFDRGVTSEEPPTGMRKWLRRQNGDHSFSFKRPEPEGGRSSSDDSKQADWKGNICSKRSQAASSSFIQHVRSQDNTEAGYESCDCYGEETCGIKNGESHERSVAPPLVQSALKEETPEHLKANGQPCTHQKAWRKANVNGVHQPNLQPNPSADEYEYHMKLSRTNSGRTYESHSYYILEHRQENGAEAQGDVQDRGKREISNGTQTNLETDIKENLRRKTREFDRRSRRHQASNQDTDDSGSEERERIGTRFRHAIRVQKKFRQETEHRETSFSRNHPLRNGARGKFQVNGRAMQQQSVLPFGPQGMPSVLG